MLIKTQPSGHGNPAPSEITPQRLYQNRRDILRALAAGACGTALASWAARDARASTAGTGNLAPLPGQASRVAGAATTERLTHYQDATTYNNYYEFGTDKSDPARYAHTLKVQPWKVEITGLVRKPTSFGLEDLVRLSAQEERIYRLRCVEGWSMVVPWVGYSLSELLKRVEPLGSAKYVEFFTLADRATMPGLASSVLDWPYVEGLRMDEAMHPLTLLTFGMYGQVLPKQNGAPLRLVVPWKYGFKSAKSLVRIHLSEHEPRTAWNKAAPQEYGFYSNVNPSVDHPRWSQVSERRLGEDGLFAKRRKTLPFNGYEAQVGALYAGMDLKKFF